MPLPATDSTGQLLEGVKVTLPVAQPAAAGSVLANAAALSVGVNKVSGADGTKGVVLPAGRPGDMVVVCNPTGSTLKVYPPVNGTINNGSANASVNVLTVKAHVFVCAVAGDWYQVISG